MTAPGEEAPGRLVGWWKGLGRAQRVIVAVVVVVVAVNVGLAGLQSVIGNNPGGPASLPVSTGGNGLAAYADLLTRDGHDVTRLQDRLKPGDLTPDATVIVADPRPLTSEQGARLVAFVRGGGRAVLAGRPSAPLLSGLVRAKVRWEEEPAVDRLRVWLPVDGTGSARSLAGDAGGRLRPTGPVLGVAGNRSGDGGAAVAVAVAVADVGSGRVVALADTELLQNDHLASADNAALGLAAAGPSRRPVVFLESNGPNQAEGLSAVPASWKWAAAGAGLAVLVGLWSAGARFGPAEPQRRELRPPRLDHVAAVAADLRRVSEPPADLDAALAAGAEAASRRAASLTTVGVDRPPGDQP